MSINPELVLMRMTFPPGWKVYVSRRLDFDFLVIETSVPNSYPPHEKTLLTFETSIPHDLAYLMISDEDFAHWVLQQCVSRAVHETQEWVRFDGVLLQDPHDRFGKRALQ